MMGIQMKMLWRILPVCSFKCHFRQIQTQSRSGSSSTRAAIRRLVSRCHRISRSHSTARTAALAAGTAEGAGTAETVGTVGTVGEVATVASATAPTAVTVAYGTAAVVFRHIMMNGRRRCRSVSVVYSKSKNNFSKCKLQSICRRCSYGTNRSLWTRCRGHRPMELPK